jgi:hypothetical protein
MDAPPETPPTPSIFLGFRMKKPWSPDLSWSPRNAGVTEVCSVSDCLAGPPDGWIDRWDFNRAGCYATEEAALATTPPGDSEAYSCFAYWLLSQTLDEEGQVRKVTPEDHFHGGLPVLPAPPEAPPGYDRLGYDVVATSPTTSGFACSPLSCNSMAGEIPVNRFCLLDTMEEAMSAAQRLNAEQPEPGTYVVVEVRRRTH